MIIDADRVKQRAVVGNLTTFEKRLREYIAEVRPSLSSQLQLSLILRLIRNNDDGAFESFMNWLVEKE